MSEQPTPVHEDATATVAELHARTARDRAQADEARLQLQQHGGTGIREGILPGGDL